MKIAVLSSRFPPLHTGGAEISAFNIAARLAGRGHEVHVVTRRQEAAAKDGFTVHGIGCIGWPMRLRYLTTVRNMMKETVRIRPDIIYCQTLYSESMAGLIAGRKLGVPVVARSVGEIYVTKSGIDRMMLRYVVRNSTLVLALTNHMKKTITDFCRDANVDVLPEGVDYDFFKNYPAKKRRSGTILYVGRLTELKCVDVLLRAFRIVQGRVPGAELKIIGDGELADSLRELARQLGLKNVDFMGNVGRDDVAKSMHESSVLVLPSKSEGFPLVIPEAMASGLPVITTAVKGLPEIVKDGENGYLVPPHDHEQLADRIIRLLGDSGARKRMCANNIKEAEKYSWDDIASGLEGVFTKLLEAGNRG
jgi:glycosyltransferase involved in cell wall biosynthesis